MDDKAPKQCYWLDKAHLNTPQEGTLGVAVMNLQVILVFRK